MTDNGTNQAIRSMGFLAFKPDADVNKACPWPNDCPERRSYMDGWNVAQKTDEAMFPNMPDYDAGEGSWI